MLEEQIQMVDLHGQYLRFKEEIDEAMQCSKEIEKMRDKIKRSNFSNQLKEFEELTKPEKEEKDVSMQTFFNMFSM